MSTTICGKYTFVVPIGYLGCKLESGHEGVCDLITPKGVKLVREPECSICNGGLHAYAEKQSEK